MKLLNSKGVAEKLSIGNSTVHNYVAQGRLPKPKKAGNNARWSEDVIDAWMIFAYGLDRPVPNIPDDELDEIKACAELAKQGKPKSNINNNLAAQAV